MSRGTVGLQTLERRTAVVGDDLSHTMTVPTVLVALQVDVERSLDDAEAGRRPARFGSNRCAEAPPEPAWRSFLRQSQATLGFGSLAARPRATLPQPPTPGRAV